MLSRFKTAYEPNQSQSAASDSIEGDSSVFLMLSSADILTLMNALFPRDPLQTGLRNRRAPLESGLFRSIIDGLPTELAAENQPFTADDFKAPVDLLFEKADRIRFEVSGVGELDLCSSSNLEHFSTMEDWAIFSVSASGEDLTSGLFLDSTHDTVQSVDDACSTILDVDDDYEGLRTAIVKLVQEDDPDEGYVSSSLKERFERAVCLCEQESDCMGAYYWWSATQQLLRSGKHEGDDTWILRPMRDACMRFLNASRPIAERCEAHLLSLDRRIQRSHATMENLVDSVTKLRNKMWYMVDVKNSIRYEESKRVALALKSMIYFHQPPSVLRGPRSFLQKPEVQVMNVMKAPSGQGGPNKLADEQVDITRKWLSYSGIDNFCKGEERIHRFCYEVKTSIRRLAGETMAETPALWASELFQRERTKYETSSSTRRFVNIPKAVAGMRSSSGGNLVGADQLHRTTAPTMPRRPWADSIFSRTAPTTALVHEMSSQNVGHDRLKGSLPRDFFAPGSPTDRCSSYSIGDNNSLPGIATSASSTMADSCSTFWSSVPPRAQTLYATSVSSVYSQPSSTGSDASVPPPPPSARRPAVTVAGRRGDREASQEKASFLQEIRRSLASLLLSDLGSPVWSCGSESDRWFLNALNEKKIRAQIKKHAMMRKFEADRQGRSVADGAPKDRRSRSLDRYSKGREEGHGRHGRESDKTTRFPFENSFGQLLETFSRHANPHVKLRALRDLRSLVMAALNYSSREDGREKDRSSSGWLGRPGRAATRHNSFSEVYQAASDGRRKSKESVADFQSSNYSPAAPPSEKQIVDFLRRLILDIRPETLFRDLQFIAAFVPGDILNKTESGTAFLQFSLAALSLKNEVCSSMVEIADSILSEELSRHHHHHLASSGDSHGERLRSEKAIRSAAGMWIITAKEGNPVAQRELAILYLTHPELLPLVTLPLTQARDTFKTEMMHVPGGEDVSKSDPQSMYLALHWMQISANGGDELAKNRLREMVEFDSIA